MHQIKHLKREPSEEDTYPHVDTINQLCVKDSAYCQSGRSSPQLSNYCDVIITESVIKTEKPDILQEANIMNHNIKEETKVDTQKIKIKQEAFEDGDKEGSQKNEDTSKLIINNILKIEKREDVLNVKISKIKSENIMFNSEDEIYNCRHCNYVTVSQQSIMEHVQFHVDDKVLQRNFIQSRDDEGADPRGSSETTLSHSFCDDSQSAKKVLAYQNYAEKWSSFKEHIIIHSTKENTSTSDKCLNKSTLVSTKDSQSSEKPFSCDHCEYRYKRKYNLVIHLRKHAGEKPYICTKCDFRTNDKSLLLRHKNIHTGKRPYSCNYCEYKCSRKTDIITHNRKHTGEKPYMCDYCDYKCSRKAELNIHNRKHTGEKPYACNFCDYKCGRKPQLNIHILIHTGEKPYACNYCDYKCSTKSTITIHNRKHTGEKPFACSYCDYKCSRKTRLNTHIRQHTGQQPYSCKYCDYKCSEKAYLIIHIRKHTGEKPHVCNFCDYKCSHKTNLMKHIRKHTGEKPYACDYCNYKCCRKKNLITHSKKHADEKPCV